MFSTRGSISTSVAMMECASSQVQGRGVEIFLLSELEKVWAATSILIGKLLVEGKNVQVPHFGAFWLEEQHLVTDLHRRRFSTRKLCFGLQRHFATKYGVSTEKVQMESRSLVYAKVQPASIVAICEVPAHRAMLALREFFLYIGEGLFRGRVFQLRFPGVATVLLRREQMQLNPDWELQTALFDVDAKRWPAEIKAHCQQVLQDIALRGAAPLSAGSARTTSASSTPGGRRTSSRLSWRSSAPPTPVDPTTVFTPAAPAGRLFSDIEREQARRREAAARKKDAEKDLERRMRELQERQRYVDAAAASLGYHPQHHHGGSDHLEPYDVDRPSTGASGESIYHLLDENDGRHRPRSSSSTPRHPPPPHPHPQPSGGGSRHVAFAGAEAYDVDEDDNEIIEVTEVTEVIPEEACVVPPSARESTLSSSSSPASGRAAMRRPAVHKDTDDTRMTTSSREIGRGVIWNSQRQQQQPSVEISPPQAHPSGSDHDHYSHDHSTHATPRDIPVAPHHHDPFSAFSSAAASARPASLSRRSYHDHCSVRELLYDNPAAADANSIHPSERLSAQLQQQQQRIGTAPSTRTEPVHFGRKRFDIGQPASAELDHVAALLKDQRGDLVPEVSSRAVEMNRRRKNV